MGMLKVAGWIALLFLLAGTVIAQSSRGSSHLSLTDADIIKMAGVGLQPPVIIAVIQSRPGDYDVTTPALTSLTAAHVAPEVIAAMITKAASAPKKPKFWGKQISPTQFESAPAFYKGKAVQMIEAPDIHIAAFSVMTNDHYGVEQVAVIVRNTGTEAIDFDPATQLIAYSGGDPNVSEYPMYPWEVEQIASEDRRKHSIGIFLAGVLGTMAADQYSQFSPTNAYEQSRSDDAVDDANAANQQEYSDAINSQLLESTLAPNQMVSGYVYFKIPKQGKKGKADFVPSYLEEKIGGIDYRMSLD
ncbi:MAG: hypothetical protein ACYCTE_16200 [Acidimicrobiales bacterium]